MSAFDVLVIGSGPAGALSSLLLARDGLRVGMLLGPQPAQSPRIGESLPPAGARLLKHLGVSDLLCEPLHQTAPGHVSIWGSSQRTSSDFLSDPYGQGWHLDRQMFDRELRLRAERSGVQLIAGSLLGLAKENLDWRVGVTGNRELTAEFLIDASGRSGVLTKHLGVAREKSASLSTAFLWCANDKSSDRRSWVEAIEYGWWYTAPVPHGKRVVSLQMTREQIVQLAQDKKKFATYLGLTAHLQSQIDLAMLDVEDLRFQDVSGSRLQTFVGEGWAAVGDASMAFDPLSSQGLFHALQTAHRLSRCLTLSGALRGLNLEAYGHELAEVWQIYQQRRLLRYRLECRWPEAKFWNQQSMYEAG